MRVVRPIVDRICEGDLWDNVEEHTQQRRKECERKAMVLRAAQVSMVTGNISKEYVNGIKTANDWW